MHAGAQIMTEELSTSETVGVMCSICRSILASVETAFCPSCGHAVFKNAVFYDKSKSTSQYDPFGRYAKPWKDKPLVKARKYASSHEKALPWMPTMRQPRRPRRDVIKVKTLSTVSKNNIEEEEIPTVVIDEVPPSEHDAPSSSPSVQEAGSTEVIPDPLPKVVLEKHIARDRVYPLVAYDLSSDMENFTLFISLLESTFANSSTKSYWLKLALLVGSNDINKVEKELNADADADAGADVDSHDSSSSKMLVLGYLSNAVGRLTIPHCDDWIELSSIDAKEHYMAQFMQKVLSYICPLVKYREDMSNDGDLLYDITIRNLSQSNKSYQEVEHVDDYGRSHTSKQTLQILCKFHGIVSANSGSSSSTTNQFCIDDRIATFQCRLRLTRSTQFPFCPVQVHVRVEYRDCNAINPHLPPRCILRSEFLESLRATHLILRIQPDITSLNLSTLIPIATFTFDKLVLMQLLKREPELHDVIEAACENLTVLEHYVTRLVNMLRLENTEDGVKYSLVGSFMEPPFTSFPWPEDVENQLSNYAAPAEIEERPVPPKLVQHKESLLTPPKPVIEEQEEELMKNDSMDSENIEQESYDIEKVKNLGYEESPSPSVDGIQPLMCPFHMVCDCQCHQSKLTLRGTPLCVFIDFGSVLIDWSSEEKFRSCWDDVEELYVSVVDVSGGSSQNYMKDEHYIKGKVCILPIKKSILDSVIEEFSWSFEDSSQDKGSSSNEQLMESFVSTLTNHFDLFKSEAHQLLKLSAK